MSRSRCSRKLELLPTRGVELPPGRGCLSVVGEGVAQDSTPLQSSKRPLDLASSNNSSPAKRVRLAPADAQRRISRRSARLQGQRPASGGSSFIPVRASPGWEIEAGVATSSSLKRLAMTKRNTQPEGEEEQKEQTTETALQPNNPKRVSDSLRLARVEEQGRVSSTRPLQKRQKWQIGGHGGNNEPQLKRARLTRKNLAELDKMAKKGANKTLASGASTSTTDSSPTKTTSTTLSGFADQAFKNGILHPRHSRPPENLQDIRERLARSRATASPTESEYKRYVNNVNVAPNEATLVFRVSGKLLKEFNDNGYHQVFNQAFTGFPKDVGFNDRLSAPQPDFIEGLEKQEYGAFPIDDCVSGAVLYKDDTFALALPHLAGEWKGRGKDMDEARLQSAYDGAALVYARNQALSYLGKPDPPGHAEITTFTTDGTNLNLFAHYAALSEDGTLEYHQYPIKSTNVVDSHQGLKDGRRGLRNEQDHARNHSYLLRDQLKEHWKRQSSALHPIAEGASAQTNEDEAGYVVVEQSCQPTPAASSSVSSSVSLPKSVAAVAGHVSCSSGHKRKASSSQRPSRGSSKSKSKAQEYWKWDAKSGQYFHRHSDGKVTWLEDSDDDK